MTTAVPEAVAQYRGISKTFGVTQALRGIDLEIHPGTIHALVGENGAGKSTALGILAGRIAPTSGEFSLFGRAVSSISPRESRALGLAAIYQELTIAPDLDAAANVFLGQPLARGGFLSRREMRRQYEELCSRLGVQPVPAGVRAGVLSVADQQLLEIIRAMACDARIILFDEPTASLGLSERRALLDLMTRMRQDGRTIVFVSHNLDEVLEVADTITVFRSGQLVKTSPRADVTKQGVVRSMLGEEADLALLRGLGGETVPVPDHRSAAGGGRSASPVLAVEGLRLPGAVEDVDLEVRPGEILGLGGLVGSGRTSVLRSLCGLEPRSSGRMWIDGTEVAWPRAVRRARSYGIALAPEDRKHQGLALDLPASVNVAMSDLSSVARAGWVSPRRLREAAQAASVPFGFDAGRIDDLAGRLSGGNQQKLLLARWKHSEPRVLLIDEPTRGIDIGAKEEVLKALEEMATRGIAVVVVSSELEEVVAVADRIEVMAEGRVVGRLDRSHDELTVPAVLDHVFAGRHNT